MKCDLCGEHDPRAITHEWFFGKELESHALGAPYPTLGGLAQTVSKTYGNFHHSAATLCVKCLAKRRRQRIGYGILLLLVGLGCAAATIAMLEGDSVGSLAKFLTGAFGVLLLLAAVSVYRSGPEDILQPIALAKVGAGTWVCWTPAQFEVLRSKSGMQLTTPPAAMASRENSDSVNTDTVNAPQGHKCESCGRPIMVGGRYCVWCERSKVE